MNKGVLILLFCVGVFAHRQTDDEHRLENQQGRLDTLKEDFQEFRTKFQAKFDEALDLEQKVVNYKTRLTQLEPTGCNDRFELQCGGKYEKCISRLLICDTNDDCGNGFDESQCDTYTPSGSKWDGTVIYNHCSDTNARYIGMVIDNYKTIDYFRSFPEVSATVELRTEKDDHDSSRYIPMSGWMDLKPYEHVLYFNPSYESDLVFTCEFDGIDVDHCHGSIIRRTAGKVCAEFYMERTDRYHTD